jgi:AraC-like DNA-binding protein
MRHSNDKEKKISREVVEYILTRDTEELAYLTAQKIAEIFQMAPSSIFHAFETDQHITLDGFINREKIHRAIYMLDHDNDISIDQLASKMGFHEPLRFSSEFKNYVLIEPQRYREIIHRRTV